ncbi:hypothetical protein GDO81_000088 [Engystomops pustulosus]|uniref:Transforming acidic coiled-coil-containing protein C-terminal domain-containing protein n=1 Tax=Engystomops pustulosus TaxID=76066 RepID=A0AAV7D389_ENGPU|nr:hypothetical protein GDO81_000088 [Engystomops pustulosus]
MSLQILNDENFGSDITLWTSDFLFNSSGHRADRPSCVPHRKTILPAQRAAKSMKVSTPRRSTDRRLAHGCDSPRDNQQENVFTLDDCAQALEQAQASLCRVSMGNTGTSSGELVPEEQSSVTSVPSSLPEDEIPLKSLGAYTVDFDKLDEINPFKSTKMMMNSPVKSETPICDIMEPPLCDIAEPPADSEVPIDAVLADQTVALLSTSLLNPDSPVTVQLGLESDVVPCKTSLDDTVPLEEPNPTPEEVSNVAAGPVEDGSSPKAESLSVENGAELVENSNIDNDPLPPNAPNSPPLPKVSYNFDPDQIDAIDPFNTGGSKLQNSPKKPVTSDTKGEPMKLEFDFGGGDAAVKKPPPKKLGKRLGVKPVTKKPAVPKEAAAAKPKEQDPPKPPAPEDDIIVPKASYNFDWDKFDDPNFNPFGSGGSKIAGSPKVVKPVDDVPCEKEEEGPTKTEVEESTEKDPDEKSVTSEDTESALPMDLGVPDVEFTADLQMDFRPADEFDFKPAADFEGFGQPIEIDYLENFGSSSFKESALRKQSLYLKFDPLLRESPKKNAPASEGPLCDLPLRSSAELFGSLPEPTFPVIPCLENEEKPKGLDLLGTFTVSDSAPLIPDPTNIVPAHDPFLLPSDVGAIVEVLKYSQKDMDAAIAQVRLEVQEKELEVLDWKNKHDKLYLEYIEMGKIIAEFESTITQMLEDSQRQKELAKLEIQKVIQEKQQVQVDLNSMEKSFSEMFKRFEKQKDVLEGYRKNEEALKKCVEDYLARIKKEEQRYQALKAHAEEKLNRANEEIAQVRSKAKAEATALQATLRKEQMKIQSLERSIEQKTKENEELTIICDDLILKMEKI